MTAALHPLWSRGMRILPYLDNWLLCSPTKQQAARNTRLLLEHVQKLGLAVNKAKSCLNPVQTITYIGMILDSRVISATLSHARVDRVSLLVGRPCQLPLRKDLHSQMDGAVWHPDPAHLQLWV